MSRALRESPVPPAITGRSSPVNRGNSQFRILGNLEVLADGESLSPGRPHDQMVLAALLVDVGRTVPLSRLIEALWGEDPPSTAAKQVRNAVSRLRSLVLGDGLADAIVTERAGYRMAVAENAVDARQFEAMVAEAEDVAAAGRRAEAASILRAALDLWRGPALAGMPGRVLEAAATAMNERQYAVTEAYHDHQLRLGRYHEIIGELSALVADHPLRERAVMQLMLALYRCGRQADALAQYRRTRALLAAELGLDPGQGLQRLHQQMLTGDPELSLSAPAGLDGTPGPASPRHPDPAVPMQLPCAVRHFAGRAAELQTLPRPSSSFRRKPAVRNHGVAGIARTGCWAARSW